jgi:hypothetical protein
LQFQRQIADFIQKERRMSGKSLTFEI